MRAIRCAVYGNAVRWASMNAKAKGTRNEHRSRAILEAADGIAYAACALMREGR